MLAILSLSKFDVQYHTILNLIQFAPGVAPPSLLAIQAGKTLHTLTSASDAVSPLQLVLLIILGFVSMIPVAFKHYFRQKLE